MSPSPYVEPATRLLSPNARPWEMPDHCRALVAGLRAEGHMELADQLERAARKPHPWLGCSTSH